MIILIQNQNKMSVIIIVLVFQYTTNSIIDSSAADVDGIELVVAIPYCKQQVFDVR